MEQSITTLCIMTFNIATQHNSF